MPRSRSLKYRNLLGTLMFPLGTSHDNLYVCVLCLCLLQRDFNLSGCTTDVCMQAPLCIYLIYLRCTQEEIKGSTDDDAKWFNIIISIYSLVPAIHSSPLPFFPFSQTLFPFPFPSCSSLNTHAFVYPRGLQQQTNKINEPVQVYVSKG